MSEHTPGKLSRRPDAGQWNVSTDECGMSCYESIQDDEGTIIGFVVAHKAGFYQEPDTEANARRLVSCWNALDGLSQDALDGGWNFKDADAYTVRIEKERDSLRAVNAELIKALERSADALDRLTDKVDGTGFSSSDAFNNALDEIDLGRAAIASARKQGEQG